MDPVLPAVFGRRHIPEIQNFNVLPRFRRRGIGTRLMDEAEQKVSERSGVAGIGVGMSPDYGAAQRLYVLGGYVPDGRGLTSNGSTVRQGDEITVNDRMVLYLTKTLEGLPNHRLRRGPHEGNRPETPSSYLSLLSWSNLTTQRNMPVDNSQYLTSKAKNRAPHIAPGVFTFV
jgi:Acetyltransferase (GNAT) family